MRPSYQIQNYPIHINHSQSQPSSHPKSPRQNPYPIISKSPGHMSNHHEQQSYYQSQSYQPDSSKKLSASIKSLQEKMQNVEALVRKKSIKIEPKQIPRPEYHQNHTSYIISNYNEQPMRNQSSISSPPNTNEKNQRTIQQQGDLRTTCPNLYKKFQQTSLRNTTHSKNLSKLNNILADIKKQQGTVETQAGRSMKKNETNHYIEPIPRQQPLTPQYKRMDIKTNFKSLNDIWNQKVIHEKEKQPEMEKKDIINGFEFSKQLGKGKFGQVYLSRHVETGAIFAIKKIIKSKVIQYKMVEQFKAQVKLHSRLQHPNIVKFYGFFEDAENIYLILEYISGGTLFDYMVEKQTLGVDEAVEYLRNVIEALSYMHDRSIAHRDIKPQNIVLTAEGVAKLCDFGWSALVETSRKTYCGTFDYAPPQILQHKNYDTSVDLWCIGVLTYEILTGKVPFEGEKRKQIIQKILNVDVNKIDYPISIPEQAKNFIEMLVQKNPDQRPKCKNLLKHELFMRKSKGGKVKK